MLFYILSGPLLASNLYVNAWLWNNNDKDNVIFNENNAVPNLPTFLHTEDGDGVPTISIIDLLSSNESYSHILLTLQKSDLVDYVNELANVTFLAPINSAFENHKIPLGSPMTRNDLDRFIIDGPIFRTDFSGIKIASTLNFDGSPFFDDFQIPILLDHRFDHGNEFYLIENANVLSDDEYLPTIDSVVLTIDDLLIDPKESVCRYFLNSLNRNTGDERFKIFSSLLLSDSTCKAMKMSNMTFLTPSDSSLNLNHVERRYLSHIRGLDDKILFISNFLVNGIIGGSLSNDSIITQNWNGDELTFTSLYSGDEIIINNEITSTSANFLLSDGIIHYFENILFDYNDTNKFPVYTPRKYLIGLEYEDFVDEIDFRGLSTMIDNNSLNQTIFVSNDYRIMGSLKNQMLYHFIKGNNEITTANKLLDSNFCTLDTDGNNFCRKVKLEVTTEGELSLNSNSKILNSSPYIVGNTSIYIIDDDLSLPSKLQTAIASELTGYGKSTEFMKKFNYSKKLSKDNTFYTVFLPATILWNKLDLTLDYLVENPNLLKKIIENLIIEGDALYHDYKGTKTFQTYSKNEILLSKSEESDGLLTINDSINVTISFDTELLFSNGIVHPIDDDLPLPLDMRITNSDLLSAQDSSEFEKILKLMNLTSVLDSTKGYSIMLPSSKSLLQENITDLLTDMKFLDEFARLHILPPGSLDMILDCYSATSESDLDPEFRNSTLYTMIPTLLNGTHLTCRELASGGMMLSITEGSANEVRILRHGIVIDNTTITSGLLLLDRPLNPTWLNKSDDKLYLHLPLFAILVGILIGVVFVLITCGCCLMLTLGNTKNSRNDDNNNNDSDINILGGNEEGRIDHVISVNERMPLLTDDDIESGQHSELKTGTSDDIINGTPKYVPNGYGSTNIYDRKFPHNQLRNYNSASILESNSLGREFNVGLHNPRDSETKGRKLGGSGGKGRRYSSTFDARYSKNASASPIDVNANSS